jgi:hypothetical protein
MQVFIMATDADEKAPEIIESGVKDGSGKGPETDIKTDSNKGSIDKELGKKYSEVGAGLASSCGEDGYIREWTI